MSDTTVSNPLSTKTLRAKAKASKPAAAPKPAAPARATHPVVQTIARGSRIDPDATLTMNLDENPCTGIKFAPALFAPSCHTKPDSTKPSVKASNRADQNFSWSGTLSVDYKGRSLPIQARSQP